MTYEQFHAEDVRRREMVAAMMQPLDVAVFAVQTDVRRPSSGHVGAAMVRHRYFRRLRADEALPAQLHETNATERGS